MSSPANPTGIVLMQQQIDESFKASYWDHAVQSGTFYYIAGRYAALAHFMVVHANILHHGVEMLMKASLAKGDSASRIREYGHPKRGYGHSLGKLWQEVKIRNPRSDFARHDATVATLDKFEDIRYPEDLLRDGAQIVINLHDVPPAPPGNTTPTVPSFELSLPAVDRLMALLFELVKYNPEVLRMHLRSDHAVTYLNIHNSAPMLKLTAQVSPSPIPSPAKSRIDWSNAWIQGLVFVLVGAVIALGISDYYARESTHDAEVLARMSRTLLITAEEKGDVELYRDAKGEITGARVIRLQGGAISETKATGDLTTGPAPIKSGNDLPAGHPDPGSH